MKDAERKKTGKFVANADQNRSERFMDFDGFVRDIKDNKWNVFGVEVYRDGELIHSYGDTKENLHHIYSATKSIVSVALGIVYDRGLIDPDASILTYLPKKHVLRMNPKQKQTFEKITVRRPLTMSVPDMPFALEGESWLDFALSREIRDPETVTFNYSNINTYLVGVALAEILQEDLFTFIEENIFQPLHITRYEYERCPEGYFYGASRMQLTVHDFSKIGLLLYQGGVFEGHRIVSEEYVKMATSVQMPCFEGGYGFFFWKYRDGFSINGKLKQKCYVLPEQGLVISYLSNIEDTDDKLKKSMERRLLGLTDTCLPTRREILSYGLSFPDTYQEAPFHDANWILVRVRPGKKAFLWTYEMDGFLRINVKVDPEWGLFWRKKYEAVIPGYHQNKDHWNTIILDGSVPEEDVKRMIAESYDLITDSPTKRIYEAVKKIPRGRVATYAKVAEMAGNPRMCRAVGNALHKNPDPEGIPCYRVVNSEGKLAEEFVFGGAGVQQRLLEADGIEVKDGRVDLKKYGI